MVATRSQPNYTTFTDATQYMADIDATTTVDGELAGQFAPHEAAVPDMTVVVDAGRIMQPTAFVEVAQQTSGTITAPTTNPRNDIIVVDISTGVLSIVTGAEAASPADPAITDGKVPVGRISLTTGTTSITNSIIDDLRGFIRDKNAAESLSGQKTFADNPVIANAAPALFVRDTNGSGDTVVTRITFEDSLTVDVGAVGFLSAADSTLTIKNEISNADVDIDTQGTGVFSVNGNSVSIGADVTGWVRGNTVYVEDDTGGDSTLLAVDTIIGAAWESIGPTGSGATNIWTAMDDIVANAKWVTISGFIHAEDSGGGTTFVSVFARKDGSFRSPNVSSEIGQVYITATGSSATRNQGHFGANNIPLNSSLRFEMYRLSTATTVNVDIVVRGWGI